MRPVLEPIRRGQSTVSSSHTDLTKTDPLKMGLQTVLEFENGHARDRSPQLEHLKLGVSRFC